MKLTAIDRTESLREDREAADLVRLWRDQVGRVRAAIAAERSSGGASELASIPVLAENLRVRVARQEEGGVTAARACALCGLRREERVEKVDERVEDSFGEWWVEFWGHVGCKEFWEEYRGRLGQR